MKQGLDELIMFVPAGFRKNKEQRLVIRLFVNTHTLILQYVLKQEIPIL